MKIVTNDGVRTDATITVTAWVNPKFNKGEKIAALLKDADGKLDVAQMSLNRKNGKIVSVSFTLAQSK